MPGLRSLSTPPSPQPSSHRSHSLTHSLSLSLSLSLYSPIPHPRRNSLKMNARPVHVKRGANIVCRIRNSRHMRQLSRANRFARMMTVFAPLCACVLSGSDSLGHFVYLALVGVWSRARAPVFVRGCSHPKRSLALSFCII
jgi:hypothetical protein